jgi:hypothetical protein
MYLYEMPPVVYVPVAALVKFAASTPPEKGMNVHVFDAVRTRLPPFDVARVSGVPLIVTPAAAVIVTVPAPRFRMSNTAPASHTTSACGGTVYVCAEAFEAVTILPTSVSTNVYVVPVCGFWVTFLSAFVASAGTAPHFMPVASALSAVKT